jgi:ATP-dependent RNA helicase DOB1
VQFVQADEACHPLDAKHDMLPTLLACWVGTSDCRYAIAMALKEKQRVIYTSPIKALSNQKWAGKEGRG